MLPPAAATSAAVTAPAGTSNSSTPSLPMKWAPLPGSTGTRAGCMGTEIWRGGAYGPGAGALVAVEPCGRWRTEPAADLGSKRLGCALDAAARTGATPIPRGCPRPSGRNSSPAPAIAPCRSRRDTRARTDQRCLDMALLPRHLAAPDTSTTACPCAGCRQRSGCRPTLRLSIGCSVRMLTSSSAAWAGHLSMGHLRSSDASRPPGRAPRRELQLRPSTAPWNSTASPSPC